MSPRWARTCSAPSATPSGACSGSPSKRSTSSSARSSSRDHARGWWATTTRPRAGAAGAVRARGHRQGRGDGARVPGGGGWRHARRACLRRAPRARLPGQPRAHRRVRERRQPLVALRCRQGGAGRAAPRHLRAAGERRHPGRRHRRRIPGAGPRLRGRRRCAVRQRRPRTDRQGARVSATGPYTVTELTTVVGNALAAQPQLEDVLVEGEISNLTRPAAGHVYFTLKDRSSALTCVCFRSNALRIPFAPENGMTVVAHGQVSVYSQQGRYQLVADRLEPSGVGALALAVEQRKRVLSSEGLFDARLKRRLPLLPRRVAVVTSRSGAALHDVVTVMGRRASCVDLVFSSATVQGDGAAETIVAALQRAGRARAVEVVLLVRGGGSLEDLMAFNHEAVARAIRACPVPVVTGVGHRRPWAPSQGRPWWRADPQARAGAAPIRAPGPTLPGGARGADAPGHA